MATQKAPLQNALTAVMKLKPIEGNYNPRKEIEQLLLKQQQVVFGAVQRLGFVHFARFVFFKLGEAEHEKEYFAIITTYDFDFEDYMNVFIDELGVVFDNMLVHIDGAPPLPVHQYRQEFIDYVRKIDYTNPDIIRNGQDPRKRVPDKDVAFFYSAYPNLSVQHVWKMEKEVYA